VICTDVECPVCFTNTLLVALGFLTAKISGHYWQTVPERKYGKNENSVQFLAKLHLHLSADSMIISAVVESQNSKNRAYTSLCSQQYIDPVSYHRH